MNLEVEKKRSVLVVHTGTDKLLDMRLLGEIRALPTKFPPDKWKGIVIDLSSVEFINSAAVSAILGCSKHITHEKKGFVICGLRQRVYELFEISRLTKLIAIREEVDESVELVQRWQGRNMKQILKGNVKRHFDDNKTQEVIMAREARRSLRADSAPHEKPRTQKSESIISSAQAEPRPDVVEPVGEWNKVSVVRPKAGDTQELKKKYNIASDEDPFAHRLDPLFDALRQLRKVAKAEGLDVDLNSTIGQIVARFVEAVKKSESDKKDSDI